MTDYNDEIIGQFAEEIASGIIEAARASGDDPIAWVTGNRYMPAFRSFDRAEEVWQEDDSEAHDWYAFLVELVEAKLEDADVLMESPDYDNALYAVDLRRFEYVEEDADNSVHETLQDDWRAITP